MPCPWSSSAFQLAAALLSSRHGPSTCLQKNVEKQPLDLFNSNSTASLTKYLFLSSKSDWWQACQTENDWASATSQALKTYRPGPSLSTVPSITKTSAPWHSKYATNGAPDSWPYYERSDPTRTERSMSGIATSPEHVRYERAAQGSKDLSSFARPTQRRRFPIAGDEGEVTFDAQRDVGADEVVAEIDRQNPVTYCHCHIG